MKHLLVTVVLVATVSARGLRVGKIGAVRDCGGPLAQATFNGTVLVDPVRVPGDGAMAATIALSLPSPDGLTLVKTVTRLSDNYRVPCLPDGLGGSCTLNFCEALATPGISEIICGLFPPELDCVCPIPAGVYTNMNAVLPFTSQWLAIQGGVAGDYTSRNEFVVGSGALQVQIGCGEVDFTLVAA